MPTLTKIACGAIGAAVLAGVSSSSATANYSPSVAPATKTVSIQDATIAGGNQTLDVTVTYSCDQWVNALWLSWEVDRWPSTSISGFVYAFERDGAIVCDGQERTTTFTTTRSTQTSTPLEPGAVADVKARLVDGDGAPYVVDRKQIQL